MLRRALRRVKFLLHSPRAFMVASTSMSDRARLDETARLYRLTPKQRRVAEVAVANPEATGKEIARLAGVSGPNAADVALRVLRLQHVRKYMAAMTDAAMHVAAERTGAAVLSAADVIQAVAKIAVEDLSGDLSKWVVFSGVRHERDADGNCSCGSDHKLVRMDDGQVVGYTRDPEGRLVEDFQLDLRRGFENNLAKQIEELSFDREGRPKIKLTSRIAAAQIRLAALTTLGKWMGLEDKSPEEPAEIREAREAFRRALANPDVARAADQVSMEMERVRVKLVKGVR